MPKITFTLAPSPHATAIDSVTREEYVVGVPKDADEDSIERLRSLEALGYHFEVSSEAPSQTVDATVTSTEQAVTEPAPEAPAQ